MANEPETQAGSSKLLRMLITGGIVVLVPMILGLLSFQFVLRPMLAAPDVEAFEGRIPPTAVTLPFPESRASLITGDPDAAAPILLYQVELVCLNPATRQVIEQRRPWFESMINKLHRNRTRAELNDPLQQDTILRQIQQEANGLLRQFGVDGEHQVLEAMYIQYAIVDL